MRIKFKFLLPLLFLVASYGTVALAQSPYPDKPVKIIVPFPPGGATDVVGRALAVRLSQLWKQQVLVENKPGAGGNIGADLVAKAPADGYTLLLASPAEITINPYLYPQMPFDPSRDFIPVARVASSPLVLVVNSKSAVKNMPELLQMIKTQGSKVNYASSGSGGPQHLAGELFQLMAGVSMTHIPYKGGAPAITDLLGGQVDLFFAGIPPALPHIIAGKLRPLAVTTLKRSPLLPQVPTVSESGFPGFNIENWQGIFVPRGTNNQIVDKIAADIGVIAAEKNFYDLLSAQGAIPAPLMPKEFAIFVNAESQKYSKLIKESGAKPD
ncbi:MAG: tripartite tricarboxylate transporter substrate binding protein [Polynucleobacter sp.]|nr:tripartite tricarboxylate transporter substrate binding protein [Polynucleobacter sp.]